MRPGDAVRARSGAVVLGLVLAGAAGCRSAGERAPAPGAAGALAELERALVGQQRILRFHGLEKNLKLDAVEAARGPGPCDVAVQVRSAALSGGAGRFSLEIVGVPRPPTPPRPSRRKAPCRDLPALTALTLTGLGGGSGESVAVQVGRVLLTPEAFLKTRGVAFERAPGPEPREVADATLTARPEEQSLARALTAPQRLLLAVDPVQRVAGRRVRYEAQIEFVAVVGADGRLREPRITTALDDYAERLLAVLPLWRYEPARRGTEPVAARITEKTLVKIR